MALGGSYASKQNVVIGAVLFMFVWYLTFNSQATPARSVVSQIVSGVFHPRPSLDSPTTCPPARLTIRYF